MKSKSSMRATPFKFNLEKTMNPLFSKAKIYVLYVGSNPNRTIIEKAVVERNINSLYNVPIIGEFAKDKDNFKGHGGRIEITDDDYEVIQTTSPLGVIPESATVYWEIIEDRKGIKREYLVVDGAYVWNRYEKEVSALKEDNFGQSMEINITDGDWDESGDFIVTDFLFSALCILGINKDGEGLVKPAFEDAKIITYSKNNEFREELDEMFADFKFALNTNTIPTDNKEVYELQLLQELLAKYNLKQEDLVEAQIVFENVAIEDVEKEIIEKFNQEPITEPTVEPTVEPVVVTDPEPEPIVEPVIEPTVDPEPEPVIEPVVEPIVEDFSAERKELQDQLDTALAEIEKLNDVVAEFKKEDHERKANEVISTFNADYGITNEDVAEINIADFSIEQLESKMFEIVGRKAKATKADYEAKKGTKVDFQLDKDEEADEPVYASLLRKVKK